MFQRYAVYYTPQGDLATRGAAWLGWDVARGVPVPQPCVDGLDVVALTAAPRKYGLHGTIKPPFALAKGTTPEDLKREVDALCSQLPKVTVERMDLRRLGRFLALTPAGDHSALAGMAAQVVMELDHFRAPPTPEELARRRSTRLSPAQERNLVTWGYPHVMDAFRFHITLTGPIKGDIVAVTEALNRFIGPFVPTPFCITSLTLAGEDSNGMFKEIERFSLGG